MLNEHFYLNIFYGISFSLIEFIGILGNIFVILSVCFDQQMKQSLTNRLIVHIASYDLLILIFNIPDLFQFLWSEYGNWILNEISCKILRSILVFAQYASVLTMCILTFERFLGLVYPLKSKLIYDDKQIRYLTLFVGLFSLICSSPNLIYLHVIQLNEFRRVCLLEYSKENPFQDRQRYRIHKSIETILFYVLPLILQVYSYSRIAKQLFTIDQSLRNSFPLMPKSTLTRRCSPSDRDDLERDTDHDVKHLSSGREIRLTRSNENLSSIERNRLCQPYKTRRNVIKMLFIIVFIYFLSLSPQVLIFLLFETNFIISMPRFFRTRYFISIGILLVTINSASNPIVYICFSSKFRRRFRQLLNQFCRCFSSSRAPPTTNFVSK